MSFFFSCATRFLVRPSIPFVDIQKVLEAIACVNNDRRCHFWEIFSRPRIAPVCRQLGMRALRSIDVSWLVVFCCSLGDKDWV